MKNINLVASIPYHGLYQPGEFIGVDRGCSYLINKQLPIKLAIGDFDSIAKEDLIYLKNNYDYIQLDSEKDETDLEYAIKLFYDDYDTLSIYGALGQRVDHTLININLLKKYPKLHLYDDYSSIYILKAGTHNIISAYQYCSFFSFKKDTIITLKNFKYELIDYLLNQDDTLCISNEMQEDACIINNEDIIIVLSK